MMPLPPDVSLEALNAAPFGIVVFDSDQKILYANQKLLEIFQVTQEELSGHNWHGWLASRLVGRKERVIHRWVDTLLINSQHEISFMAHLVGYPRLIIKINTITSGGETFHLVTCQDSGDIEKRLISHIEKDFSADIRVAQKVQNHINRSFSPMVEGRFFKYHFEGLFRPSAILSGDMINMQQATRRYTAMFMGDGKGHGLPAALYSTLIYSYVNMMAATISSGESDTGKLVEQINSIALRDFSSTGEYFFFSSMFILIDGNGDTIRITGAGHPPLFRIREGVITTTNSHGPIIGVMKNADYSYTEMKIQDGDIFLLYTDGIYDVCFPGYHSGGPDEFFQFLSDYIRTDFKAEELVPFLSDSISKADKWGNIADDITVMTMRVEKKEASH